MNAPTGKKTAPADAQDAAEAPTLLDALARAPAAAALVAALDRPDDRAALRLVHSKLRDAVGEATTKLEVDPDAARPSTARRWPRLEELTFFCGPDAAALEVLALEPWGRLRMLCLGDTAYRFRPALDVPAARALAAALPRLPALQTLELFRVEICDAAAAELFRAASADAPLQLRSLIIKEAELTPTGARALAATGWRLEELDLGENVLGADGLAALVAAPTFMIRRLGLRSFTRSRTTRSRGPWRRSAA
jgi:hypothetical protein